MARSGHLGADLVRAAGDELAFDERKAVFRLQRPIERTAGLRARLRRFGDVDAVFDSVLEEVALEFAVTRLKRAVDDAEIALVDLAVFDLLVQDAERLGGLGGDDDAAGVAVDAVAERGREGMLLTGAPFVLCVEVGLDVVDERLAVFRAVVRVDGLTRLLIDEEDVLVLIYNI